MPSVPPPRDHRANPRRRTASQRVVSRDGRSSVFGITLPAVWRELVRNLGWTPEQAEQAMCLLVHRAFADE